MTVPFVSEIVDQQDVMQKFGLSNRLRSCLKHDYLKVDGTWKTATEIARLALSVRTIALLFYRTL
jgi:hypothetical protein